MSDLTDAIQYAQAEAEKADGDLVYRSQVAAARRRWVEAVDASEWVEHRDTSEVERL